MNSAFEANLVEALDALEAGAPVEEILSRYPEHAEDLRPILDTSRQLSRLPVAYSLSAEAASRDAFLTQAASLRAQERRRPAVAGDWRRLAFSFASLAIFVVLLGGLLVGAAQEALPGQALYPVKRIAEDLRLSLASPVQQETLQEQFAAERREEIYALLASGQEGTVACAGTIEAFDDESWTLDGLVITVEASTVVTGEPALGATAEGVCNVTDGRVVAERLQVEEPTEIQPEPTPTGTARSTSTATTTPTTTATPTATDPTPTTMPLLQPSPTVDPSTPPPGGESEALEDSDDPEEDEDESEIGEEEDGSGDDDGGDDSGSDDDSDGSGNEGDDNDSDTDDDSDDKDGDDEDDGDGEDDGDEDESEEEG